MIELLRKEDFNQVFEIMKDSFPSDEYRSYDGQKALLAHPDYSLRVLYSEDEKVKAFIASWEFPTFMYVEHFAVNTRYRNKGLGAFILNEQLKLSDKMVCLEVESLDSEMNKRRIGFYERNHFFLNEYPYVQPAMADGKKEIPLFIMTSHRAIDEDRFLEVKNKLYKEVYNI